MNVDNTKTINILSLCTGYGGLELGLARALAGVFRVIAVEVEAYALANLAAKAQEGKLAIEAMWPDLKTFPAERFRGCFDFVLAGYPCQPFSVAGKRKGTDDPRHLWPHIARIVQAVRPVWCFFENVPGHLTMGFPEVYRSLRKMGYSVEAGIFSAAEVGAPHRRERLFIVAYSNIDRSRFVLNINKENEISPNRKWGSTKNIRTWSDWKYWLNKVCKNSDGGIITKADFFGVDDGSGKEPDRVRLLGNGVVPQQVEKAFRYLMPLFKNK